jgi:Ca-activated chloride channel family protein
MFTRASLGWLFGSFLWCHAAFAAEPKPRADSDVMLVLDASSRMAISVGQTSKMKLARDVAHELVSSWDSRLNVGLTAYGHRRASSCADLAVVAPVKPLNAKALNAAVDRLAPRGQSLLVAAVQFAADQLDYSRRRATLVVISDGSETCGGDPCAAAADLKRIGVAFTAHVVGVGDLGPQESRQLGCIAQKTGGEYYVAKDAMDLKRTLSGLVRRVEAQSGLARQEDEKKEAAKPAPVQTRASLRQLEYETEGSVQLRAVRTPNGAPVRSVWKILSADKSRQVGEAEQDTTATFRLAPGAYVLRASAVEYSGNVNVELPFTVAAGRNRIWELAYNSGRVMFSSVEFTDGPLVRTNFRVRPQGSNAVVASAERIQQPTFELLPGKYQVAVELGGVRVRRDFDVEAGDNGGQVVAMNVGTVALRALTGRGGELVPDAHWRVYPNRAKAPSVASAEFQGEAEFSLAQGEYVAKVQTDGGKSGQVKFSIKAGERNSVELIVR